MPPSRTAPGRSKGQVDLHLPQRSCRLEDRRTSPAVVLVDLGRADDRTGRTRELLGRPSAVVAGGVAVLVRRSSCEVCRHNSSGSRRPSRTRPGRPLPHQCPEHHERQLPCPLSPSSYAASAFRPSSRVVTQTMIDPDCESFARRCVCVVITALSRLRYRSWRRRWFETRSSADRSPSDLGRLGRKSVTSTRNLQPGQGALFTCAWNSMSSAFPDDDVELRGERIPDGWQPGPM